MDLISYAMGKQASGGGSQPTGTIEITSNGTHDVSNYASANVNVESVNINDYFDEELKSSDAYAYNLIKKFPSVSFKKKSSASYMFYSMDRLTEVIEIKDTENVTNFSWMFGGCSKLETIPIFSTASATNMDRMFNDCSKLSDESLSKIMQMCINATSFTGTKTLKYLGISSTLARKCQNLSNYQAFLNAGWTTGY